MPTRNINLTEHFDAFVSSQVSQGHYRNASEVMRAGLRLLEQHTQEEVEKLAMLRKLAKEGFDQLDQGQGIVLNELDGLKTHIRNLGRQGVATAKRRSRGA